MATSPAQETIYLVDAHSLIFQVFHALPEMTSPAGLPTNALFGFIKDMLYLRNERRPDYLVCAFDVGEPTNRTAIAADYKAHRAPMPDDLRLQIPLIREMLAAMRIPVVGIPGYEADDAIATLATAADARGMDVFICTSDKDCRQLLTDRVRMFNLRKREAFDAAALALDWGVRPDQVVDFQTLVGDSVDNVKGVVGIGPKTAGQLLQKYGTLDNLVTHIDELTGKKKENVQAFLPRLETTRTLVTLDRHVPMDVTWDAWRIQPWDGPKLLELFRGWGFRGFAEQVRASLDAAPAVVVNKGPVQGELFPEAPAKEQTPDPELRVGWECKYQLVHTPKEFERFLKQLKKQPRFAIDLETTGLDPHQADIVGLAFCWKEAEAYYLAVRGPAGAKVLDPADTLAQLKPVLEDTTKAKVNQNIKYDWIVLKQQGVELAGVVGDPMVADYLLHAGERGHNMEVMAEKYLQHRVIPISALIGKGKKQLRMDEVPPAKVAVYSAEDADVAWRLSAVLEGELETAGFKRPAMPAKKEAFYLYDDLEVPLIGVLADMETAGIRLDMALLKKMSGEMEKTLAALEQEIYQLAGKQFNIGSVKQLRDVLYKDLGLKSTKKTAIGGEASTDQETLEQFARQGVPLARKLLDHRKVAKLKSTYVDALPSLVNPKTGRLHASFNQTVAATGRLSSSEPNLQNIPIRSELGGQIRQAILPAAGWDLLTADYSQIELRLLAHFSGDEALKKAFADDQDIHTLVAAQIYGVGPRDVTAEMRRTAKTVNFGVIYGMSAYGLSARLELDREEAEGFIDAYFARYPRVLEYQERLLADCRKTGWVRTILGRRRAITGVREQSSYKGRNQPEREAINMEIQGSAADLIKVAMLSIHRRLLAEQRRSRLLLQIHDELVFEMPPEERAEICRLVRAEMTAALADRLSVPLKVDMSVGPNWLDTVEVEDC